MEATDHVEEAQVGVLGPFSYQVKIVAILTTIHAFLRKPVNIGSEAGVSQWQREYVELDGRLRSWRNELPAQYSDAAQIQSSEISPSVDSMWIMLHCTYYM